MRKLDDVLVALGSRLTREGYGDEVRAATMDAFPPGVKRNVARKCYLLARLRVIAVRSGYSLDSLAAFDR